MGKYDELWQGQEWRKEQRARMRWALAYWLGWVAWWGYCAIVAGLMLVMVWQVVVGFGVDKWLIVQVNNFLAWWG